MDSCTVRSWMTYPTFPATRYTLAACRSWWIPRGAISSRNAGCRKTNFSRIPSPPPPTRRRSAPAGLIDGHLILDDQLRPALDLLLHEALLLARRDRENAAAVALDARGEFRIGDDAGQRLAQGLDGRTGRPGGRKEAEPAFAFEFHEACLVDRRHLRKMARSSRGGHGQALEAPDWTYCLDADMLSNSRSRRPAIISWWAAAAPLNGTCSASMPRLLKRIVPQTCCKVPIPADP